MNLSTCIPFDDGTVVTAQLRYRPSAGMTIQLEVSTLHQCMSVEYMIMTDEQLLMLRVSVDSGNTSWHACELSLLGTMIELALDNITATLPYSVQRRVRVLGTPLALWCSDCLPDVEHIRDHGEYVYDESSDDDSNGVCPGWRS
jgi:hypothetical protein